MMRLEKKLCMISFRDAADIGYSYIFRAEVDANVLIEKTKGALPVLKHEGFIGEYDRHIYIYSGYYTAVTRYDVVGKACYRVDSEDFERFYAGIPSVVSHIKNSDTYIIPSQFCDYERYCKCGRGIVDIVMCTRNGNCALLRFYGKLLKYFLDCEGYTYSCLATALVKRLVRKYIDYVNKNDVDYMNIDFEQSFQYIDREVSRMCGPIPLTYVPWETLKSLVCKDEKCLSHQP